VLPEEDIDDGEEAISEELLELYEIEQAFNANKKHKGATILALEFKLYIGTPKVSKGWMVVDAAIKKIVSGQAGCDSN
jgi:hypothetical protein